MKQAILVVAFGSTVDSAREHNIDSVVEHIRKAYPDYTVASNCSIEYYCFMLEV